MEKIDQKFFLNEWKNEKLQIIYEKTPVGRMEQK